jgi:hypothetical protein
MQIISRKKVEKNYRSKQKRLCLLMLQIIKMIERTTEHPQRFDGGEIILPFSLLDNQAI